MMDSSNVAILAMANAAIIKGDYEGFLSFCTDDTVWTFVGDTILQGKEAVRNWMKENYKVAPDFNVENLIPGGDYVTAIGTISLRDHGGKLIDYEYCDVWRFRNGKMAELKAFVIKLDQKANENH
jgi:uncharacterized protein